MSRRRRVPRSSLNWISKLAWWPSGTNTWNTTNGCVKPRPGLFAASFGSASLCPGPPERWYTYPLTDLSYTRRTEDAPGATKQFAVGSFPCERETSGVRRGGKRVSACVGRGGKGNVDPRAGRGGESTRGVTRERSVRRRTSQHLARGARRGAAGRLIEPPRTTWKGLDRVRDPPGGDWTFQRARRRSPRPPSRVPDLPRAPVGYLVSNAAVATDMTRARRRGEGVSRRGRT